MKKSGRNCPEGRLTVHWDGKQLRDLSGVRKVDRMPILVSGGGKEHLLAVAKLPTGKGVSQVIAVAETVREWNIQTMLEGACFDTTNSNSGEKNGSCVLLERELGIPLLRYACRHHIDEIVLGAVVELCLGPTKEPTNSLFVRFRAFWETCDKTKFDICPRRLIPAPEKKTIVDFCREQLKVKNRYISFFNFPPLANSPQNNLA